MLIKWVCETDYAGCEHRGEIEVDDGTTDEEIDELVREEVFNVINWSWIKAGESDGI